MDFASGMPRAEESAYPSVTWYGSDLSYLTECLLRQTSPIEVVCCLAGTLHVLLLSPSCLTKIYIYFSKRCVMWKQHAISQEADAFRFSFSVKNVEWWTWTAMMECIGYWSLSGDGLSCVLNLPGEDRIRVFACHTGILSSSQAAFCWTTDCVGVFTSPLTPRP